MNEFVQMPLVVGIPPTLANGVLLVGSFLLLLLGAEIFTNGVEWLGHRLGVSESATGSILAAVGTALPETMIPVIAIVNGVISGDMGAADSVGVGAILGAPFMLATIAMFLIGSSVYYFGDRRMHGRSFQFNAVSTRRDLSFFLVGFSLAFIAALLPADSRVGPVPVDDLIAFVLVGLYVVYVYRSLKSGTLMEGEDLEALYLGAIFERGVDPMRSVGVDADVGTNPGRLLVFGQTLIALGLIVGGAHLFVGEVEYFATEVLHFPTAILALLLAPLATELPEKFNSIIWISRDKDTLAIGNITGAMAFQGTLPVTLGILFTSWNLSLEWGTTGFLNGFSAILAIVSASILYLRSRSAGDGAMAPAPFLIGGIFYVLFLAVVVYHVLFLGVTVAGGH
jgi:cation:H+ antiporter